MVNVPSSLLLHCQLLVFLGPLLPTADCDGLLIPVQQLLNRLVWSELHAYLVTPASVRHD